MSASTDKTAYEQWYWAASDDGNGGRIAWVVDGDGYSIVEYLTVEQAQTIVRAHNQAMERRRRPIKSNEEARGERRGHMFDLINGKTKG